MGIETETDHYSQELVELQLGLDLEMKTRLQRKEDEIFG